MKASSIDFVVADITRLSLGFSKSQYRRKVRFYWGINYESSSTTTM
jgi:hypothetical protein